METDFQRYIHASRYARWLDDEGRRETWEETVDRYVNFLREHTDLDDTVSNTIRDAILSQKVMPSMRALMTAGKALDRDHVAGYNCAYLAVDSPRAFDEAMYILLCGTGVGYSVERQYVNQLPEVAESFHETDSTIVVADSKIGWASAYRELISMLYAGKIPRWDLSRIRPAGARLKTFGGRASGPEPLQDLFRFTVQVFANAAGRKLNSLECHDIMCKVADIVVVGGVRRSALISLSNLTDERMRHAKDGNWFETQPQRALANNSACYTEKPDMGAFMREWESLYASRSGERGIFNRVAAQKQAGRSGRRDTDFDFGTNPCSEIILRNKQFCNLTEVVVRPSDSFQDLKEKVTVAAILGTVQSSLTNFRYLSSKWKKNCEEERLLGVSLTGIMDHPVLNNPNSLMDCVYAQEFYGNEDVILENVLKELKDVAIEINRQWAEKLGINPSSAITCVKPSGTVSQLVDSSSGIHPRHSKFYIRGVRSAKSDPLCQFMIDQGVPYEDVHGKEHNTGIFYFPIKAPEDAITRKDVSAIQQLELWKIYAEHWCEHKPSITVYVREDEWLSVGAWVYKNFDLVSGISFLPFFENETVYTQLPYKECTEEEYNDLKNKFPKSIAWDEFTQYESTDNTTGSQEYACSGGQCEVE